MKIRDFFACRSFSENGPRQWDAKQGLARHAGGIRVSPYVWHVGKATWAGR
jgi:hypothetical protein